MPNRNSSKSFIGTESVHRMVHLVDLRAVQAAIERIGRFLRRY